VQSRGQLKSFHLKVFVTDGATIYNSDDLHSTQFTLCSLTTRATNKCTIKLSGPVAKCDIQNLAIGFKTMQCKWVFFNRTSITLYYNISRRIFIKRNIWNNIILKYFKIIVAKLFYDNFLVLTIEDDSKF